MENGSGNKPPIQGKYSPPLHDSAQANLARHAEILHNRGDRSFNPASTSHRSAKTYGEAAAVSEASSRAQAHGDHPIHGASRMPMHHEALHTEHSEAAKNAPGHMKIYHQAMAHGHKEAAAKFGHTIGKSLTNPTNRPPTQVAPNFKCNGCEHYCSQLGLTGMCGIGTFPQICGDGSDPNHGYRPLAGGVTEVPMMSDTSHPGGNVPSDQVSIPFVVVELSKSLAKRARATSGCQLPHARPTGGGMSMSLNVPINNGLCCCPTGAELAKEIRKGLPPHYQRRLSDESILKAIK